MGGPEHSSTVLHVLHYLMSNRYDAAAAELKKQARLKKWADLKELERAISPLLLQRPAHEPAEPASADPQSKYKISFVKATAQKGDDGGGDYDGDGDDSRASGKKRAGGESGKRANKAVKTGPASSSSSDSSSDCESSASSSQSCASSVSDLPNKTKHSTVAKPKVVETKGAVRSKENDGNTPQNNKGRFSRIDTSKTQYANEKLKNNSFTAKSGALGSYGERAHRDLAPTRGKDFRQEKNKKKRGNYRGGHIDMGVHSIKFQSDSE